MSISKIIPAALNSTLEIAPALLNINFDFSLWKVEAPKEFDGVGSALSSARRDKAENGLPHATAQRLGALFEAEVPSFPKLLSAYGQRASEISQVVSLTPSARKNYGAFSGLAGSDATSIWAAATSGRPTAMAAHLLACFLARIWDGPEAISIWVELVRRRKEIIKAKDSQSNLIDLVALEAAKQEITRAQIAEWDTSARSWLRTADTVKNVQYKQLKLIIDNLKTPVNKIPDTYESVMAAWKNSLSQMEGLIEGIAQQAIGGDVILAISAWHLYPDMRVVVPTTVHVSQQDPSFASGGILTIGLEIRDSQPSGVFWSLPLACLRYYGDPIMASSSVNSNERSRLTLDELLLSIVGCFLGGWEVADSDTSRAIKWLAQLANILDEAVDSNSGDAKAMIKGNAVSSWFSLLLSAARFYQRSSGDEQQASRRLVSLGRKHGKRFLGLPDQPLFGLTHRGLFVGVIKSEDEQIQFLREVAREVQAAAGFENHHFVIRYKHRCQDLSRSFYEYATALPLLRRSWKRDAHEREYQSQGHCRWLYAGEKVPQYDLLDPRYHDRVARKGPIAEFYKHARYRYDKEFCRPGMVEYVQQDFENRAKTISAVGEFVYKREHEYIQDITARSMGIFWPSLYGHDTNLPSPDKSREPFYMMTYGDIDSAALFVLEGRSALIGLVRPAPGDARKMFTLFEESNLSHHMVVQQLLKYFQRGNPRVDPYLQCAKGISTAAALYKDFTNATVDVRVLQLCLYESRWLRSATYRPSNFGMKDAPGEPPVSLLPYKLDRADAFSCIAMFESGVYEIDPNDLGTVMAMSSGDSIYASVAVLGDPSEASYSHAITRVRGNIGRPGLAYLVPPRDPLITKVAISEWPNISRENFDGQIKNSFDSTSLHLSFTGAQSRVNLEFSGAQDDEVYMLETLISVFDKGRWIADLDPLKTFSSSNLRIIPPCAVKYTQHNTTKPCQRMTTIENWLELIDAPESRYAIVQAHDNWEARLAAASISVASSVQTGVLTLILPRDVCWDCFENTAADLCKDTRQRNIIIS